MRAVLTFLLFIPGTFLFAQNFFYETSFGSPKADYARSIKLDNDSNIYIAGFSNNTSNQDFDITISKLRYNGQLLWTKYLGNSFYNAALFLNKTTDGNFIICGETQVSANDQDGFVMKLDTSGQIIWNKTINLPLNQSLKYCEQTSNGDIISCGYANDSNGFNDNWLIKITSAGDLIWMKSYGTASNEYADQVKETQDGNYIMTADIKNPNTNDSYDIELFKLDTAGIIIWDKIYGDDLQNGCQGILVTSDNNYLSYGESEISASSPFDFWIDLVSPSGDTIWHRLLGGPYTDAAFSAVEINDGFIFTGYSSSYNNDGPLDLILFKTDKQGNMLWQHTFGSSGIDIGYEIIKGMAQDFFVTGKYGRNADDYYLLHFNEEGWAGSAKEDIAYCKLFPNPTNGLIYSNGEISIVEVYNVMGRLVLKENLTSAGIDLSFLNSGLYMVRAYDRNQSITNFLVTLAK